ncbi:uncharacterized protein LOC62_01G000675 [Vanrija pseudolonga]|uniref:Uncharacterized protein n=1 Tax=Vanrija pseudolonga TaxID=143232 RepID=A0AAF0Y335_9TREE|nr:hypothetical protein LOC62_01G000675 [Vanrija pseudolonga]
MDAQFLEDQVLDLASQLLTARLEPDATDDVASKFAPDAVLDTPAYRARGSQSIADTLALHSHFGSGEVAKSEWDDEKKTSTLSIKLSYALPTDKLPWPLTLAQHLHLPFEYHKVRVQLAADESVPTSSDAASPSKYHVSKVTVPHRKQHRLLHLFERVVLFLLVPFVPFVVFLGVVVMKFLHRHPLAEGAIKLYFAAVKEIVVFFWRAAVDIVRVLIPVGALAADKITQIQDEQNGTSTDVGASPTASPVRRESRLVVEERKVEVKKEKEHKHKAEHKPKHESKKAEPKPKAAEPKAQPTSEVAREEQAAEEHRAPHPLSKDEVHVAPSPAGAPSFAAAAAEQPGDKAERTEVAREEQAAEQHTAPHPLSKDEVHVPPAPAGAVSFAAAAGEHPSTESSCSGSPPSEGAAKKKKTNKKKNHTKSQL